MIIAVACSQCGKKYDVAGRLAGKKVRCKECHANFRVPVPTHIPIEDPKPEPVEKAGWADEFFADEAAPLVPSLAGSRARRKAAWPDLGASPLFLIFLIAATLGAGAGATWGTGRAWPALLFAIPGGFGLVSSLAGWESFARSRRFRLVASIAGDDGAKLFHQVLGLALLLVALLLSLGVIAWPSANGRGAEAAAAPVP